MEEWTDIFAEELKDIEAPLPDGDLDMFRAKYDAVQRRRKAVVWRWLGAVSSVAAVLAIVFLVFRNEPEEIPQYSEENHEHLPVQPDSSLFQISEKPIEITGDMMAEAVDPGQNASRPADVSESSESSDASESPEIRRSHENSDEQHMPDTAETFDVVKDTDTPGPEKLIADSSTSAEEDYWNEDVFAEDMPRRKVRVSMGTTASGGLGGGNVIPRFMSPMPEPIDPTDTTGAEVQTFSHPEPMTKAHSFAGRSLKDTDWHHYLPVSFGLSARFGLTDRLSLSTGLNYSMYASRRTRTYTDGSVENDMQNVHYLGIPLRCDWKIMDKSNIDMYLGFGGQVEKCVYAKAGSERLHEKKPLWSAGVSLGFQYDISDRTALFVEPDVSWKLNRGTLETYRLEHDLMFTARAGFRIDL